ncbi:hypothetical protein [Gordonia mangrovi]|uniref:hypothetical protein n=1 Tax=Gordonia mangrovi TaxID=2665643 RepID=UPI0021AC5145|nr:hypothetical protein [Gordonia mangrovi]UVF77077.1 hypothetical protein NWF22_17380 [Gordonia mangrovi]
MRPRPIAPPLRRRVVVSAIAAAVLLIAGCAASTSTYTPTPTSVPTSAEVTVPAGPVELTEPSTALGFGDTAVLPANAFAATGPRAMFTVTGITPAEGVPDDISNGGTAYFLYVTVTSLAGQPIAAPSVIGLSGSPDGRTPTFTRAPTPNLTGCPATAPPEQMRRGESYTACLISVSDAGQRLERVIYWADTSSDTSLDYKSAPVVWAPPGLSAAPSSAPAG